MGTSERGPALAGERKSVSVLFSDLSGYTALSERADPEHVRSLVSQLLGEAAQVVAEYEGHIERFLGDAIMAVFGVPKVHEDDAQRAVLAAMEIERRAERIALPEIVGVHGPLKMHSAIATGYVVHGDIGPQDAGETVLGDTVNVAARLTSFAGPGEIVVGEHTYEMTCGQFEFAELGSVSVRGRAESVPAYRLIGRRVEPVAVRRLTGLRADFVGRRAEMECLRAATRRALSGSPTFVAVLGGPGTGKSRLVDEFKRQTTDVKMSWRVGQCYSHSQRLPYSALKDLLGRAWGVDQEDPPERVRATIASHLERRGSEDPVRVARLGRLWDIESPLLAGVDPEAWRAGLYDDALALLDSIAEEGLSVVLVEDLHWADRQSLELLNYVLANARNPVLTICTSRGVAALESIRPAQGAEVQAELISLEELDPDDSVEMCRSLLDCERLPSELSEFVHNEFGGNPFFIEEMVNTLAATGWLERREDCWSLTRPLEHLEVPLTVTGVIEARVDRLQPLTKRVAQEASLIGRVFSVDVLRRATRYPDSLDGAIAELEGRDLIHPGAEGPEEQASTWEFRHTLVQEAIARGLLSDDRAAIHDRIGEALEEAYADRATEFAGIIAGHFSLGHAQAKAVEHLIRAAESCMDRGAAEEADSLYREAYCICVAQSAGTTEPRPELVPLLCGWARVGFYMGDCKWLEEVLLTHYGDALASADERLRATYEFWLGNTLWHREKLHAAEEHLLNALALAEPPLCDVIIESLAHAELGYTYADLGRLDEAEKHVDKACELAESRPEDYFVWQAAFGSSAYLAWCQGRPERARAAARKLLQHADAYGNVRCLAFGHWSMALASGVNGDLARAIEQDEVALAVSSDPWLLQFPKFFMAICAVQAGDFVQARGLLEDLVAYAEDRGATTLAVPARGVLGAALAGSGQADRGIAMLEESERQLREDDRTWAQLNAVYILGSLHAIVARGEAGRDVRTALRNPRFMIKHAFRADGLARGYLSDVIERADEIGSYGLSGECWLALAELHQAKRRTDEAVHCYDAALDRFAMCGADAYYAHAAEARARLTPRGRTSDV